MPEDDEADGEDDDDDVEKFLVHSSFSSGLSLLEVELDATVLGALLRRVVGRDEELALALADRLELVAPGSRGSTSASSTACARFSLSHWLYVVGRDRVGVALDPDRCPAGCSARYSSTFCATSSRMGWLCGRIVHLLKSK